jgi:hypothetical protein
LIFGKDGETIKDFERTRLGGPPVVHAPRVLARELQEQPRLCMRSMGMVWG